MKYAARKSTEEEKSSRPTEKKGSRSKSPLDEKLSTSKVGGGGYDKYDKSESKQQLTADGKKKRPSRFDQKPSGTDSEAATTTTTSNYDRDNVDRPSSNTQPWTEERGGGGVDGRRSDTGDRNSDHKRSFEEQRRDDRKNESRGEDQRREERGNQSNDEKDRGRVRRDDGNVGGGGVETSRWETGYDNYKEVATSRGGKDDGRRDNQRQQHDNNNVARYTNEERPRSDARPPQHFQDNYRSNNNNRNNNNNNNNMSDNSRGGGNPMKSRRYSDSSDSGDSNRGTARNKNPNNYNNNNNPRGVRGGRHYRGGATAGGMM